MLVPYSYYKCLIPDYFSSVPLHWHSEFEINYILSGRAEMICSDKKFVSKAGDIIIIPPNTLHAIYPYKNDRQLYDTVVFSPDMLGASADDRCSAECIRPLINGSDEITPQISKDHQYYGELSVIVENIFSCAKGNSPQLDLLLKSELMRLFWLLGNSGDIYRKTEQNGRADIIRPALEYISENFRENITVDMLAEQAHLSRSYFMSLFRQTAGVSAIEYVTQLRIKYACRLLTETDKTAAETAFECGFRNISNFNRQFRKAVGCTPNEYRKMNRK